MRNDMKVWFVLALVFVASGIQAAEPTCSLGYEAWDFVFDITTDTGKALYSLALTAHAAGTVVLAYGGGDCYPARPFEVLLYLTTSP
jgi:hypothetical protein